LLRALQLLSLDQERTQDPLWLLARDSAADAPELVGDAVVCFLGVVNETLESRAQQ
jgi:hypothetical protein